MNIAAVQMRGSYFYQKVDSVLEKLSPPVYVMKWDNIAEMINFTGLIKSFSHPKTFSQLLDNFQNPINLHVFTDGSIRDSILEECQSFCEANKSIPFNEINLHFFEFEHKMNMNFLKLFSNYNLHINGKLIGCVKATLDWDEINFDFIMKDDSFKATVLTSHADKQELKKQVSETSSRIWTEYSKNSLSIQRFYARRDVDGCIDHITNLSTFDYDSEFHRKILDILILLDKDTYSATEFTTNQQPPPNRNVKKKLECSDLTAKLSYYDIDCIFIKERILLLDDIDIDNPFTLLESEELMQEIAESATSINSKISPLKNTTFIFKNDYVEPQDLILHNNGVLSTFFQNDLPGCPVLWHMVYLYIVAMKKLPKFKERLFEEIRFLGNHTKYYLSLSPDSDPFIYEKLKMCFWYIAHISHRAFVNSSRNVLRSFGFNSQLFLEFYRNVYDNDYQDPIELPIWRLWRTLYLKKSKIMPILTHYFTYDKLNDEGNPFQYVLYRQRKSIKCQQMDPPAAKFRYLTQLDLKTVLCVYQKRLEMYRSSVYNEVCIEDIEQLPEEMKLFLEEQVSEPKDTLDHVKIHLRTCHPLLICPESNQYWKRCVGEYNVLKESHLKLFENYCIEYGKYPSRWQDLLIFQNKTIYTKQKKIPVLFPNSIQEKLEKVLKIFELIMKTFPCEEYLQRAKMYKCQYVRMDLEEFCPIDVPPRVRIDVL